MSISDIALEILMWGALGLALILMLAVWLFIAFAVVRLVAEFAKAFKETKNLDLDEEQESW